MGFNGKTATMVFPISFCICSGNCFIWKTETLAFKSFFVFKMVNGICKYQERKLLFSRTGSERKVLRPSCDEVSVALTPHAEDLNLNLNLRSGETSREKILMVLAVLPDTPKPFNFNMNLRFSTFYRIPSFSSCYRMFGPIIWC